MEQPRDYKKIYAICGMLGPIIYTLMWIIGGFLHPDYSHIRNDVSTLLSVGAPNKLLLDLMLATSNILNLIFFSKLHKSIDKGKGSALGPSLLLISAILGLITGFFFPLDEGGEVNTFGGQMHVILVGSMAFLSMLGMVALWRRFKKASEWQGYGIYTLITLILTIIFGLISAILIESEIMGLLERISICVIFQYNFVIALKIYRTP